MERWSAKASRDLGRKFHGNPWNFMEIHGNLVGRREGDQVPPWGPVFQGICQNTPVSQGFTRFYKVFIAFCNGLSGFHSISARFCEVLQRFTSFHTVSARLILFWILNSHPQKKYLILEKKPKRDPPTATGIHVPPMNIARQVDFEEVFFCFAGKNFLPMM